MNDFIVRSYPPPTGSYTKQTHKKPILFPETRTFCCTRRNIKWTIPGSFRGIFEVSRTQRLVDRHILTFGLVDGHLNESLAKTEQKFSLLLYFVQLDVT